MTPTLYRGQHRTLPWVAAWLLARIREMAGKQEAIKTNKWMRWIETVVYWYFKNSCKSIYTMPSISSFRTIWYSSINCFLDWEWRITAAYSWYTNDLFWLYSRLLVYQCVVKSTPRMLVTTSSWCSLCPHHRDIAGEMSLLIVGEDLQVGLISNCLLEGCWGKGP